MIYMCAIQEKDNIYMVLNNIDYDIIFTFYILIDYKFQVGKLAKTSRWGEQVSDRTLFRQKMPQLSPFKILETNSPPPP